MVLAVRGRVRLCAALQVDGRESSDRALDPGRLSPPPARGGRGVVERARASGLRREDPVRAPGGGGIGRRTHGAAFAQHHGLGGSTERAGSARALSVRLELLPLEDGRARESLAALRTAAHGESMGAAVPPELRSGCRHHRPRVGIPSSIAGPAGGMGGLRGGPLAGARDLSERPAHCRQALDINPEHASAHYNLGNVLAQHGKLAEASEHHRQALRLKPDYADAHNNLGNVLAQQGKLAEASEQYQRALQIRPDDADAHNNLGNALAQQGKLSEAVDHYRRALEIKPDFAKAASNLGSALAQQGKLSEAIEHSRRAQKAKPNCD